MSTGRLPIPLSQTVPTGYGRGRLAPAPAASIARIDAQMLAQLGVRHTSNDMWRSPEQADKNAAAWAAWQNGTGPKAPYALDRYGSIHCRGYADDTDDWTDPRKAAILRANGWRQTALYPVGDPRRETWHGEYDEALDQYLGTPASSQQNPFTPPIIPREADMPTFIRTAQHGHYSVAPGVVIGLGDPKFIEKVQYVAAQQKDGPRPLVLDVAPDDLPAFIFALSGCPATQIPAPNYAWYAALNPTR